jgi:hypothetical protein
MPLVNRLTQRGFRDQPNEENTKMRRTAVQILIVLALMGVGTVVAAAPAQAAQSQCTSGEFCVWEHSNYSGCFRGMPGDINNYATASWETCTGVMDNKATSVKNEGTMCNVRFYQFPNQTGITLRLFRESSGNDPFRDADLSNGTSDNPQLFNDAISSHGWC